MKKNTFDGEVILHHVTNDTHSFLYELTNVEIENFDTLKKYIALFSRFGKKPNISKELFTEKDLLKIKHQFENSKKPLNKVNELEEKILSNYEETIFESEYHNFFNELKIYIIRYIGFSKIF